MVPNVQSCPSFNGGCDILAFRAQTWSRFHEKKTTIQLKYVAGAVQLWSSCAVCLYSAFGK